MTTFSTKNTIGFITVAFAVGVVMASSSGTAMAEDTFNLQDLIDTMGDFQVEDQRFSNFQYSSTGDMPPASAVNVVTLMDGDGNPGFRLTGYFTDTAITDGGSDALLFYNVDVTDPAYRITAAHIAGNPNLLGPTGGSINVSETFLPLGANGEFTGEIYDDTLAGTQLMDTIDFGGGHMGLSVQKDIGAIVIGGSGTMSFVDQTFSQSAVNPAVPEPAATVLWLLGVTMCGMIRQNQTS
jgi:hypothetical protein